MGEELRYGIVIPVMDEEACLGAVLDELGNVLGESGRFRIAVGLNGSSDRSGEIARERGALVGETEAAGYGFGCRVAVDVLEREDPELAGYIFYAGDGGNSPQDVLRLVEAFESGAGEFVIGQRTRRWSNWKRMGADRALPNVTLGLWLSALTFRPWLDLGPLRLIEKDLFRRMGQREWTWGWTAEGQILASRLGARIGRVTVDERPRIAGEQKVSRVSFLRSLMIGLKIAAAGWRVRWRKLGERAKGSEEGKGGVLKEVEEVG